VNLLGGEAHRTQTPFHPRGFGQRKAPAKERLPRAGENGLDGTEVPDDSGNGQEAGAARRPKTTRALDNLKASTGQGAKEKRFHYAARRNAGGDRIVDVGGSIVMGKKFGPMVNLADVDHFNA